MAARPMLASQPPLSGCKQASEVRAEASTGQQQASGSDRVQAVHQLPIQTHATKPGHLAPGFRNQGNSCFLNSVLQCLIYCPPLATLAYNRHHAGRCVHQGEGKKCGYCLVERRLAASLATQRDVGTPRAIFESLEDVFSSSLQRGCQEDAHEFFCALLEAMEKSSLTNLRPEYRIPQRTGAEPYTEVQHIFGGRLRSQVHCPECQHSSNTFDSFCGLSLEISDCKSVHEALNRFTASEKLEGPNAYRCEKCKRLVTAEKRLTVEESPNVLVIHLKRFDGPYGSKLSHTVGFEETLDLTEYLSRSSAERDNLPCCAAELNPPHYNLTGVVVHQGFSANSGHYYAHVDICDAKGGRQWYEMNDEDRTRVSSSAVLNDSAYMLFYVRTRARPRTKRHRETEAPAPAAKRPHLGPRRRLDSPMPETPDTSEPPPDCRHSLETSANAAHSDETSSMAFVQRHSAEVGGEVTRVQAIAESAGARSQQQPKLESPCGDQKEEADCKPEQHCAKPMKPFAQKPAVSFQISSKTVQRPVLPHPAFTAPSPGGVSSIHRGNSRGARMVASHTASTSLR